MLTGDAPTAFEWSTILLPTKVRLILEVLRYISYYYFQVYHYFREGIAYSRWPPNSNNLAASEDEMFVNVFNSMYTSIVSLNYTERFKSYGSFRQYSIGFVHEYITGTPHKSDNSFGNGIVETLLMWLGIISFVCPSKSQKHGVHQSLSQHTMCLPLSITAQITMQWEKTLHL